MAGTLPGGYIIEHDTRGVLLSQDHDPDGSGPTSHLDWTSRWDARRARSEAWRLSDLVMVRMALSRIDPTDRRATRVRSWGSWTAVSP